MNKKESISMMGLLFFTITTLYSIGAITSLMRLIYGGDTLMKYQLILLPIITYLGFIIIIQHKNIELNKFSLLLLFCCTYGCVRGAVINPLGEYYFYHLFQMIFAIILYSIGLSFNHCRVNELMWRLQRISRIMTVIYIPINLVFVYLVITHNLYMGMSAGILILATSLFVFKKDMVWGLGSVSLLLLTGKRGEILGLTSSIITILYFMFKNKLIILSKKRILQVFIVLSLLIFGVCTINNSFLPIVFLKFVSIIHIDYHDIFSAKNRIIMGGRVIELQVFCENFVTNTDWSSLLFGKGFGWFIPINVPQYTEVNFMHTFHISPLNAIAQYGLLLGIFYWLALLNVIYKAFYMVKFQLFNMIMISYVVGIVITSMFSYIIAVDPIFWICMGVISRRNTIICRFTKSLPILPYEIKTIPL
ncbi:MAG: hypothetical protein Q8R79_02150 [Legionellaceae bacterium]|nr:hypothetical protein [Legionellaceae bacterium]